MPYQWQEQFKDKDYLTVSQVANIFNIHPQTIRNWIKQGDLEAVRHGVAGNYKIPKEALLAFLNKYSTVKN
ncbi:MAG: helix-turn-helix domain-containing protein [Thermodesulfobacteriota bacterium]